MRPFFNPYPKYLQIRRILLGRIEQSMRVGDQLPTEHALCAEFFVSRETIRAALATLEEDGVIHRTPGRGTFVTRLPRPRPERRLTGMIEDFSALNLDTEARVLETGPVRAPPLIADAMGIEAEDVLFRITRLRLFEGRPLAWHEAFLPLEIGERVARLDLRRTSMHRELRDTLGIALWEEQHGIEAVAADPKAAELLDVLIDAPLLCLTRLYLGEGGHLVVFFRSLYRSDRYLYTAKLTQPRPPSRRRPQGG